MTARTLWGSGSGLGRSLLDHTAGDDRPWDARLLRWDVLGSLGHIEGLRAAGLLGAREYGRLRQGLRRALAAVDAGRLVVREGQEDVHTAVEDWLTREVPRRILAGGIGATAAGEGKRGPGKRARKRPRMAWAARP